MSVIEYDKKLTATGDKVVIRKDVVESEIVSDGIVLPMSAVRGHNLSKGTVESVGPDAVSEGIVVGDRVMFDHYSTFGETYPVCVTKVENVICKIISE